MAQQVHLASLASADTLVSQVRMAQQVHLASLASAVTQVSQVLVVTQDSQEHLATPVNQAHLVTLADRVTRVLVVTQDSRAQQVHLASLASADTLEILDIPVSWGKAVTLDYLLVFLDTRV